MAASRIDIIYQDGKAYLKAEDVIQYLKLEQEECEAQAKIEPTHKELKEKFELLASYAKVLATRFGSVK